MPTVPLTEENGFFRLPTDSEEGRLWSKLWPQEGAEFEALETSLIPDLARIAKAPAEGPGELSEEENLKLEALRRDPTSRLAKLVFDYAHMDSSADRTLVEDAFPLDSRSEFDNGDTTTEAFIDVRKHPELLIGKLSPLEQGVFRATFLIRREYMTFAKAIFGQWIWQQRGGRGRSRGSRGRRFFWTGQEGIGKSFGIYFLLFLCLSLGIPVVAQLRLGATLVFSSQGAFSWDGSSDQLFQRYESLRAFAKSAWSLHDVDDKNWRPDFEGWTPHSQVFVWASAPNFERWKSMKHLQVAGGAVWTWHMAPWSESEMLIEGQHCGRRSDQVLHRVTRLGPIPRSVFNGSNFVVRDDLLRETISKALKKPFETIPSALQDEGAPPSAVHRVFLLVPKAVEDPDVDYRTEVFEGRAMAGIVFLSPLIQRIAMQLFVADKVRAIAQLQQLTASDLAPSSFAGCLLEVLVHEWLKGAPLDMTDRDLSLLPVQLRTRRRPAICTIEGSRLDTFTIRSEPRSLPAYLQPVNANFPLIDSALLTDDQAMCLLQVSTARSRSFDVAQLVVLLKRFQDLSLSWRALHLILIGTTEEQVRALQMSYRKALDEAFRASGPPSKKRKFSGIEESITEADWSQYRGWVNSMSVHGVLFDVRGKVVSLVH